MGIERDGRLATCDFYACHSKAELESDRGIQPGDEWMIIDGTVYCPEHAEGRR